MKTKTLLIAAVMFFCLTAAAFAQATFSVGSIPVTAVVNTGQTELAGAITFSYVSGTSVAGTISISYGVPVTSTYATGTNISNNTLNTAANGSGSSVAVTVNTTASSNANGVLVINVGANALSGSFTVTGVRVAVAGTSLTSLMANLSSTQNAITAGQTSVTVISSIAAGIASGYPKVSTAASINANTGAVTNGTPVNITVKEGFLNAWGQVSNATAAGLRFTVSAAPPTGVTFTFPATATTDGSGTPTFTTMNADGTALGTTVVISSASSSLQVYYKLTSDSDATKQETLTVPVTVAVDTNAVTLPITAMSFTVVASMAPIGTAFATDGTVITTAALIPRYAALDSAAATLVSVTSNTTVMLFPFVQSVAALGYNTGIAISNTTLDPGSTAMGFTKATSQSGTIKFYFYPSMPASGTLPTAFTYTTTAGSPGSGLSSSGGLAAGSTYTVLLTQLLAAAGQPTDFNGYVFGIANFSNAHALFVVSNFTSFSQGALALILTSSRSGGLEALNN